MIRRFLPLTFFLFSLLPALAQNAPLTDFAQRFPKPERLEGTIEQTQNGVTSRARLSFQAPDKLRIEIEGDAASQIRAQVIVAAGNETRLYDPATKRVQRLPYNIARQWWRGWDLRFGGPANLFLFGLSAEALDKFYESKTQASTLTLQAQPGVEARFINDYVRFGGSGDRIFYAPLKRHVWNRPEKIVIDAKDAAQLVRSETRDGQTLTASIAHATGLPKTASLTDEKNRVVASFAYALKPRATAFPGNIFSLDLAPGQVIEDASLRPLAEYSGTDANSKFNLGVALWKHSEELDAAFAAWDEAGKLAPQATAPLLATFEAALAARDTQRAADALDKLGKLLGADSPEVLQRRATLAVAQRDWAAAQRALETAVRLQPQNLQLKLLLADVLRTCGEFTVARDRLLEIVKTAASANSTVQAEAALMLGALSWNDGDEVLKLLPEQGANLWQKIARAQIFSLQGKNFDSIETDNPAALAALGVISERVGQDAPAIAAWQKIVERTPSPGDRTARLHLVALYARRGDIASSLAQYREIIAATPDLQTQSEVQNALLGAWRKAFRQNQLRTALEQRALSTNAGEDDARLWLAFQDQFGSADDIENAIGNGLARFPRSAWWRAQRAEQIMAQVPKTPETAARDRLQRDALDYAEQAVALEPEQPYYAIQRALILTQRATPITGVIDIGRYDPLRKIANQALDELLKKWPDDPDVQLAVATQRLALEEANQHAATIDLLMTALRGGAPEATDRHFISFSARQVLVTALREAGRDDDMLAQYQILFRAARTSGEELGVALNLVRWLMNHKNAAGLAQALTLFAHENWSFADSQQLLQPLVNVVASKAELWPDVLTALRNGNDPYGRYVAAMLLANRELRAREVLAQPEAPLSAERDLAAVSSALAAALKELEPVASGADRVLAARAAGLLGEQAINRGDAAAGETRIARAAEIEARAIDLRIALSTAQLAEQKSAEALATRDAAVRAMPHSFENLQRLAKLSDRIGATGDEANTARLASIAMNAGSAAPEIAAGDFQMAALIAARTALYANQNAPAITIYNGLSSAQWSAIDRAVALLDWQQTLNDVGKTDQAQLIATQLDALGLSPQERNIAQNNWEAFNAAPN
jgi:tetratricopeptide (TPR) repeat protein